MTILHSLKLALFLSLFSNFLSAQTVILSENFSDNHRKWEDDADEVEVSYVKDGRYHIKIAGEEEGIWHWFYMGAKIEENENWILESTIYLETVNSKVGFYGLIWGAKDAGNMFQLFLHPLKRTLSGIAISEHERFALFPTIDADTVNFKKAKFVVLKAGEKTYCLINGKPVGKVETGKLFGDRFGFVVGPKTEVSADNINLRTVDLKDPSVVQIRKMFNTTEEKLIYYNAKGFPWSDKGEFEEGVVPNTKEESETYRIYTEDDDENIVGYVKEYNTKTNKLLRKFQAKRISKFWSFQDILEGEYFEYNDNGNIDFKASYFNPENLEYKDMMKSPTVNLYKCDNKERIIGYKEIKDGNLKREIAFDENGKIERAQNTLDEFYFEQNNFGQYDKVYEESFDPPVLDWIELDISSSASKITKDGYYIKAKQGDAARMSKVGIDFNGSDFSIGCMIEIKGSGTASLVLGMDNKAFNYTAFAISHDGQYTIFNMYNGVRIPIAEWTNSSYLRRGLNALDIIKIGKKTIFSINGTKVESVDYFPLANKSIGLSVMGVGNEVYFTNMVAKEIGSELPEEFSKFLSEANEGSYVGSGTGFFISSDGYLVTNNHVVENAKEIYVDLTDNGITKTYRATIVKTDAKNDLAIIKISKNIGVLPYSLNTGIGDVGTKVFTLGFPYALSYLGKEIKFTDGSISSKTGFANDINTYQISVPVQPGNSGGPLFDSRGNLVGVINAKFTKGDNVSYAIKSPILKSFLDLSPNIVRPSTVLKTDDTPITSLIKRVEKYVVLVKIK